VNFADRTVDEKAAILDAGRAAEQLMQHALVSRVCGLSPVAEPLLRVGYALNHETLPLALLEWAERAGDRGPIACDLAAERGSIAAALPELRVLFA
jgi:hypothetical protein